MKNFIEQIMAFLTGAAIMLLFYFLATRQWVHAGLTALSWIVALFATFGLWKIAGGGAP